MHRLTDPPASWSESSLEVPPSPAVAVLDPTDQMSALPSIPGQYWRAPADRPSASPVLDGTPPRPGKLSVR